MDLNEYFIKQNEIKDNIDFDELKTRIIEDLNVKGYKTDVTFDVYGCYVELKDKDQKFNQKVINDLEFVTGLKFQELIVNKHKNNHLEVKLNMNSEPLKFVNDYYTSVNDISFQDFLVDKVMKANEELRMYGVNKIEISNDDEGKVNMIFSKDDYY